MVDTIKQKFNKVQDIPLSISSLSSSSLTKKIPSTVEKVFSEAIYLSYYIPHIITKLGEDGCLYINNNSISQINNNNSNKIMAHYFSPELIDQGTIKSVTGAGDSFVGTLLANLQKDPFVENLDKWQKIIQYSQKSAIRTLQSELAVSPLIDNDLLLLN